MLIATHTLATLPLVSRTKEIPESLRKNVGEEVRRWIRDYYADNQSAAARALGVNPSHLNSIISGRRGVGLNFLLAFQEDLRAHGRDATLDELLGVPHRPAQRQSEKEAEAKMRKLLREELAAARAFSQEKGARR